MGPSVYGDGSARISETGSLVDTTVHRDVDKDATATSSGMRKDTLIALALFYRRSAGIAGIDSYASGRSSGSAGFGTAYAGRITDSLARRLDQTSAIHVKQAEDQEVLRAGWVYIAPRRQAYGESARTEAVALVFRDKPPIGASQALVQILCNESLLPFRITRRSALSLQAWVQTVPRGSDAQKHKKIYVISESQDTCVVYGMPRSIEQQGLSDKVVPINQIADAIIKKLGD